MLGSEMAQRSQQARAAGDDLEAWLTRTLVAAVESANNAIRQEGDSNPQRRGMGTYFFNRLVQIGREKGVTQFEAYVLVENSGMLKIFHRSGMNTETITEEGVVSVNMKSEE